MIIPGTGGESSKPAVSLLLAAWLCCFAGYVSMLVNEL